MDTQELYRRGLAIRKEIFGKEAVDKRMAAVGDYGAPLQNIVNAYAYGDIWARPGMERKTRSLIVLAMTAAINRPAEFKVHVNGALNNGTPAAWSVKVGMGTFVTIKAVTPDGSWASERQRWWRVRTCSGVRRRLLASSRSEP